MKSISRGRSFRGALIFCATALLGLNAAGPASSPSSQAQQTLRRILETDETWIKVHAAEALLAAGDVNWVRDRFLALVPTAQARIYRVGIYRVLAESAASATEREQYLRIVEGIFLDSAAPDRSQAIETLCKLRVPVAGAVLARVRAEAHGGGPPLQPLSLWSLAVGGDESALDQLGGLLSSPSELMRLDAAYALRWLHPRGQKMLTAVTQALARESTGTTAYPYLLSAAFTLRADPQAEAVWRNGLQVLLADGTSAARFEAGQALLSDIESGDLKIFVLLLDNSDRDSQVAGARGVLEIEASQGKAR